MKKEVMVVSLRCVASCYMPGDEEGVLMERYEDEYGDDRDVYDVPESRVDEYLETGNFRRV